MVTPSHLVAYVRLAMAESGGFSSDSIERLTQLMTHFASFAERGFDIAEASLVTGLVAEGFVKARSASGSRPAVATMHVRRSALRLLYSEGRRLGLVHHDPTLDLALPPRSSLATRPLTDDEVALCRSYSVRTLTETRQPAAWALAEATARSAELAKVRVCDLDLATSRVWIAGSTKTEARWGTLSDWGKVQIERRLRAMPVAIPGTPLVCGSAKGSVNATSSASIAIAITLRRAGLAEEPDVRPGSVAAWAGARELAAGRSIDEVARLLGIRSLDRTAQFIGFDWCGQQRLPPPGRPS
jgi:integrase